MRLIATFILSMFLLYSIYSQKNEQTLRGYVMDYSTKMPLTGATVIITYADSTKGTYTDARGGFQFDNLKPGRYQVTVSFVGYETQNIKNIELNSARQTILEIYLREQPILLNNITIKDSNDEHTMLSARTFNVEQTERYAGSLGDVARMAGNFAGVSVHNDTRNDIIIRGNSPTGLIWRLDNIEIRNPNHFAALGTTGGPVSMLNNNTLTNSEFYSGAFPARYGNGLSGVFDLKMRKGNDQKHEFTGQVGFNGFEIGTEGPLPRVKQSSYLLNARYSTLAVMHYLGIGTGTGAAVPYYKDLAYKIFLPTSSKNNIAFIGLYGNSHIDMMPDTFASGFQLDEQRTAFQSGLYVTGIQFNTFMKEKVFAQLTMAHQSFHDKTIVDNLDSTATLLPFYRSSNYGQRYTLQMSLKTRLKSKLLMEYGFSSHYNIVRTIDSVKLQSYQQFVKLHNARIHFYTFAVYWQSYVRLTKILSLEPGIHLFFNHLNEEFSAEPRFRIQCSPHHNHTFLAGFGIHSQMHPPQIYFVLSRDSTNTKYHTTNTSLRMSKAHHYVVGYMLALTENLNIKAEAYYQWLYNIPVTHKIPEYSFVNIGEFFSIPSVDSLVNKGNGRNMGIELTLERNLHNGFYFLATFSLFDSKSTGYDGVWRNTAFNNRLIINVLAGYEIRIKDKNVITVDVKTTYAGGKPYLPIDLDASIADGTTRYDFQQAYAFRYPIYFRLDLRFGYKRNSRRTTQQWAIDLQNLTNHKSIIGQMFHPQQNVIQNVYQFSFYPMALYRIYF